MLPCFQAILLKRLDQCGVADVLHLPQRYREGQRWNQIHRLAQPLRRNRVSGIGRELRGLFFKALTHGIFQRSGIESDVGGGGFFQKSQEAVGIEFRTLEQLLQLVVKSNFGRRFQRVRDWDRESSQEPEQRRLVLKDRSIYGGCRG